MKNKICFVDCQVAISSIKNASTNTTVIIDFDETLLLRNSTAEYLNSLRPRLLGLILLKFLSLIRPWSWLPKPFRGSKIKDWFLVTISTILLPWTLFIWRKKAKNMAQEYSNLELVEAVNKNRHSSIIIASLGFNFIIAPILKEMNIEQNMTIGCRFWQGAKDRGKGKLLMVREVLSESALKSAIVITDSYDDLPLLEIVEKPCLTLWEGAKYNPPLNDTKKALIAFLKFKQISNNRDFFQKRTKKAIHR